MLNIKIAGVLFKSANIESDASITMGELLQRVSDATGFSHDQYYVLHNGRLMQENDVCSHGCIDVIPRLLGGKGGFGSMLRAIGAQIEKTTNREACRDLSGRRLRDINQEKRLKAWVEKMTKREKEAALRKQKKLEKLCAEPKHEFKDKRYDEERAEMTERVGDAVEEGFKAGILGTIQPKEEVKPIKRKTILDLDIDSDEIDTSDDDNDDDNSNKQNKMPAKKRSKVEQQAIDH